MKNSKQVLHTITGFELVTQYRVTKNSERSEEKVLLHAKKFLGLQIIL